MSALSSWWRRNRWALLALAMMAPLAVAAHSSAYVNVYQRPVPSKALQARGDTYHLEQDASTKKATWRRSVDIKLDGVAAVPADGDVVPVAGATLHTIDLTFTAPPDSPLDGCQIELVDGEGRVYSSYAGREVVEGSRTLLGVGIPCVPEGHGGPVTQLDGEYRVEGERPPSWPVHLSIAVPSSQRIQHVRLWWDPPTYVEFKVER